VPIVGGDPNDPDLSNVEIILQGRMDNDVDFDGVLDQAPATRWIHSTWAGVDELHAPALDAIAEREILLTSSAGAYAPGITEFTLWAMVALARGMTTFHDAQREARWANPWHPSGGELHGRRLGIIGYGEIGRHLAIACQALGMEVWATRRTPMLTTGEPIDRWLPADALTQMLPECHFVVVAASLNRSAPVLVGEPELAIMREGAFLVNIGRGDQVDEDALIAALRAGRLGGAVLDVMSEEPLGSSSPLWSEPGIILTPHLCGDTPEAQARTIDLFEANLRLYLSGNVGKLSNRVLAA
jgi:phosphoglycerate dehydrogenase-like enzyme